MDVPTPVTNDLVDFSGQWSNADQKLVTTAAQSIERTGLSDAQRPPRAPWIASRQLTETVDMYLASRFGFAEVFRAQSAGELAEKIRHLDPGHLTPTYGNPNTGPLEKK